MRGSNFETEINHRLLMLGKGVRTASIRYIIFWSGGRGAEFCYKCDKGGKRESKIRFYE